jgi:hypothetical protein
MMAGTWITQYLPSDPAVQSAENPAAADALAAVIAKQAVRERGLANEREQEKTAAKCRQEEVAVMAALGLELRELRDTDPGMSLLNAVEFITPAPDRRLALYRRCSAEDRSVNGIGQDDTRLLKIASSIARDLALLERRAIAEGFSFG